MVAACALSFEDGLKLVYARAMVMQKACEAQPSTMSAIIALPDEKMCIRDRNKEIHEVNHQLAEDNGKLIP